MTPLDSLIISTHSHCDLLGPWEIQGRLGLADTEFSENFVAPLKSFHWKQAMAQSNSKKKEGIH